MIQWSLASAAGYVALVAATLTVALGALGSSRRRTAGAQPPSERSIDRRAVAQLVHRSTSVITVAMLALHVTLLVLDSYVSVGLTGALIPFTAGFRGFAVGLGSLATYGLLAVTVSGALRRRMATSARAARVWRAVHLTAYAIWPLAMLHGVLAGSTTGAGWSWALYGGCLGVVLLAGWTRMGSAGREAASSLSAARASAARAEAPVHETAGAR